MNRKIIAIVLMLSITAMLVPPLASGAGIPNPDTLTYATIGGPDADWGTDPAGEYDTSSSMLLQQVYEPLFMYNKTSTTSFIPMLADTWPGFGKSWYVAGVYYNNWIEPLYPSIESNLTYLHSIGIYPPTSAEETWVFHIRPNVKWQNESYDVVKPHDVAYSIQRGMLQDAGTGVQWLFYTPLTGAGPADTIDPMFDRDGDEDINETEYFTYLRPWVEGAVGYNDTNGYVWFNLPAPYAPFMQILVMAWGFVTNRDWCIERNCWDGNFASYAEFYAHWHVSSSPLMASDVISSAEPAMGTGPYRLKVFSPDPHTGYSLFEKFDPGYWQGWSPTPHAAKVLIKTVEEWANRKAQFFSTDEGLQVDLSDVPRANCPELHLDNNKSKDTLPGFTLKIYNPQVIGSLYFCYDVSTPTDYMPKLGGVDKPDLLSDRDLRLAIIYCFNATAFYEQYFLGEAFTPTTIMAKGTTFYNESKPVRNINLALAEAHFKKAWGGQVWSNGITLKLTYNTGNVARQTIMSMIADIINTRINWTVGVSIDVVATPVPWSTYLPAMESGSIPCFVVGWMADFPDPVNWFVPFMDPDGTYSGLSQHIEYGLDATSLAAEWNAEASYGPPTYTNILKETVTEINNTYVHHLNMVAQGSPNSTIRSCIFNELMDIHYAEAGSAPMYESFDRHYEREWVEGWIGGYGENPISPGDYFYQMYKAAPTTIYEVDLNAINSIQNTSSIPQEPTPLIVAGDGAMTYCNKSLEINYTLHITRGADGGPIIYVTIALVRNITSGSRKGEYYFPKIFLRTIASGGAITLTDVTWYEEGTATRGIWTISIRTDAVGTAGGAVFDTDVTNNKKDSVYKVTMIVGGDFVGAGYPFPVSPPDGIITVDDIRCFVDCWGNYTGIPPIQAPAGVDPTWGDLTGAGYPPPSEPDGAMTVDDIRCFVDGFFAQYGYQPP